MGGQCPGTTGCYDLGSFKPSEWTEYMKSASLKDLPKPGKRKARNEEE